MSRVSCNKMRQFFMLFAGWVAVAVALDRSSASIAPAEEQVHLALGSAAGEMNVQWTTASNETNLQVQYWPANDSSNKTTTFGDSRSLNVSGLRYTHVAVMHSLAEGAAYRYTVGDRDDAKLFQFTYKTQHVQGRPDRHVIFGDLGASHAFSLCLACSAQSLVCDSDTCATNTTAVGLVGEVGKADMFLHLGDFAYDLADGDGMVANRGDQFFRNIEQISARVPYMVSHGNHEHADSLTHYVERFRSQPGAPDAFPGAPGNTPAAATNTMYFSWDAGLVHYIALSTELWFGVSGGRVDKKSLLAWLEGDLKKANANRARVPWVVAHGHRDVYCSTGDDSDCTAVGPFGDAGKLRHDLEPLFFKYGVDFWINGHEHSYERTFPLHKGKSDRSNVDPKATVYIVTGAAGSQEMHEGFTKRQPTWSAFRSNTFGYSVMEVHNSTHIHWQQVQTDPTLFPGSDYGRVVDDTWFVQHKHGPFNEADAPKGTAFPADDESAHRELDHWAPLLFPGGDAAKVPSSALVRQFRETHGDAAWARREDELMAWVNKQYSLQGHRASKSRWEDVRGESTASDGAWFKWKEL